MTTQIKGKLNRLDKTFPEGLIVDAAWLEREGYSRALRSQYVSAGWLEQPARSVFRRSRGSISWEQVVISLQTLLGHSIAVGGRTALELQGYAHYLSHAQKSIHIYSNGKLPAWLHKLPLEQRFVTHNGLRLFPHVDIPRREISLDAEPLKEEGGLLGQGLRIIQWGQWNRPLVVSTPERAYLELLDELPQEETFPYGRCNNGRAGKSQPAPHTSPFGKRSKRQSETLVFLFRASAQSQMVRTNRSKQNSSWAW